MFLLISGRMFSAKAGDRWNVSYFIRFGHFKIWHGEGSVLVKVSFSSVFGGCLPCKILSNDSPTLQTVGYSFFAAIFNVGWAATKVDNLSLYAVALMIFSVSTSNSPANVENQAFIAFYVINELQMAQSSKALVPAIIFICSFIVSVLLQGMKWTGQRLKAFYSCGGVLWIFCGVGFLFLSTRMNGFMYILSMVIGIANALMTVTGVGASPKPQEQIPQYLHFSVTRFGLGLIPAICSLAGVAVAFTMKLHTSTLKTLMEPLLE
ncbi:hypothetical protein LguiA_019411 [Lonicera macranthoides]